MKKLLSALFAVTLLTVVFVQAPVQRASAEVASSCTFDESRSCQSECQSYHPPGCTCSTGSTCTFDIDHIVCHYEYACLYGGHDPTGGGFKTLEVVHDPYDY